MPDMHMIDTGGSRPALIFLHGVLMSHAVWKNQIEAFSDEYRVLAPDLRGFGQSPASGVATFEDYAGDIRALIEARQLSDVTLVGWSMGGAIAQVFSALHGQLLRRLVLVGTTPQLIADATFPAALPLEGVEPLIAAFRADFKATGEAFAAICAPEDAHAARTLAGIITATDPDFGINSLIYGGSRSLLPLLPSITVETFVIAGADDKVCMPESSLYLASHIPGCRTPAAILKDAGHAAFLTRPEEFNRALRDALAG